MRVIKTTKVTTTTADKIHGQWYNFLFHLRSLYLYWYFGRRTIAYRRATVHAHNGYSNTSSKIYGEVERKLVLELNHGRPRQRD